MKTPCWKTDSIKNAFKDKGYVLLKSFLDEEAINDLNQALHDLITNEVPTMPPHHVFYEDMSDKDSLKQIQKLFEYSPFFSNMMFHSQFNELADFLLEAHASGQNMQFFNKPPGIGKPTPPHQDGFYFKISPCDALTMWLALDVVDEENGCVRYIPGSHKELLRPHSKTGTLGFSQGISDYSQSDRSHEIPIHAHPGDLLVHHAKTIHRADQNHSASRSRKAIGLIYYSQYVTVDSHSHQQYQQNLTKELLKQNKI